MIVENWLVEILPSIKTKLTQIEGKNREAALKFHRKIIKYEETKNLQKFGLAFAVAMPILTKEPSLKIEYERLLSQMPRPKISRKPQY